MIVIYFNQIPTDALFFKFLNINRTGKRHRPVSLQPTAIKARKTSGQMELSGFCFLLFSKKSKHEVKSKSARPVIELTASVVNGWTPNNIDPNILN